MSSQFLYVGDRHAILSALRDLIEAAEQSIILQMYLFAASGDQTLLLPRLGSFPYAETVAKWLVEKKQKQPHVDIVVILDSNTPANPARTRSRQVRVRELLGKNGIVVLCANLFSTAFDKRKRLHPAMNFHLHHRDVDAENWVEDQNRWQALHNVEDHRKNLIIDGGRAAVVTSHNLFDPSYDWYENLFWLCGDAAQTLWGSALSALSAALLLPCSLPLPQRNQLLQRLSAQAPDDTELPTQNIVPSGRIVDGYPLPLSTNVQSPALLSPDSDGRLIENEQIRTRIEALIAESKSGDEILVATAYFSDQDMFSAIAAAVRRGVRVRILIDSLSALLLPPLSAWLTQNLVNHQVMQRARRLQAEHPQEFSLRIHHSHAGAMMHLKTVARLSPRPLLIGGQANFTPNSFSGAYLETDLEITSPTVISAFAAHFDELWELPAVTPLQVQPSVFAWLHSWFCGVLLWLFARVGLRP